ncbi:hypothetical protein FQH03_09560 [Escherichia coli]|uniref:hypothetical protein n=1 Tax=Enterobacteriaceae TaxID=543 RepID=UPI000794DF2A|nr:MULTISPECIES: hypothetical protein [Enterobacteriaceae]EFN4842577.1 hypothetical protein [Escherichia coli]HAT7516758.1 hypothetical protein [Kluyvera ascorbata]EGD4721932.1 hypothetical protein [Escherichia coli]EGD4768798.1 hypothetical protein [Escherichia coli]EGD5016417.1 hypothetical protein [Escherichia coli]
MHKLIVLSLSSVALLIPSISSALTIHGDIHPGRYTFFLTQEGSSQLKQANDRLARNPQAYTLDVNHTGIQPFDAVRWDGEPVKAVTCVLVDGIMMGKKATWSQCKDESGAEYFGNAGWPVRDYVAKACEVGKSDCPVYLVLQTDPPTMRNDMAKFAPAPKNFNASANLTDEIKNDGCQMANNSFEYAKSSIRCSAINTVRFIRKQNTEAKYEADLTTTSGENLTMTVGYTYGNASSKEPGWRTISVKEGGIITDIRKQGQWLPNGYK